MGAGAAPGALVIDHAREDVAADRRRKDLVGEIDVAGAEIDENFARAARNIPGVDVLPIAGANVYDILRRDTLVLTTEAVEVLEARLK